MNPIQIIRIEHPDDGNGIWCSKRKEDRFTYRLNHLKCYKEIGIRHEDLKSPFEDGLLMDKNCDNWFCAFISIKQLIAWVLKEELEEIIKDGFIIYLLEVSDYQIGEHQVIYTKESVISKQDISSLFN